MNAGYYKNITAAGTYVLKNEVGILRSIIINKPVASATITVYDNNAASGTKIATITLPATLTSDGPHAADYFAAFSQGLTIVVTNAPDITIVYS